MKPTSKRILGIIAMMAVWAPCLASAATYYVAKTGNNANSCAVARTHTTPKRTVAAGLACISAAGDTLQIKGGTYAESIVSSQLRSGTNWTTGAVTVKAYGSNVVVLTGGINVNSPGPGLTKQYIIFKNLVLRPSGFAIGGGGNGGTVRRIKFDGIEAGGTPSAPYNNYAVGDLGSSGETGTDSWVVNSKIHDCVNTSTANGCHGMYVAESGNVVENTEIYDVDGYGIHNYASSSASNNIYRNLYIHDVGSKTSQIQWGILLDSGTGNMAYNNLVIDNQNGIEVHAGNFAYNNTIVGSGVGYGGECCYAAIRILGAGAAKNNIIYGNDINSISNSGGTASNNLTTDPDFANPSLDDFHLLSTSDAIDAGATLGTVAKDYDGISRPQGGFYDIGAYEY